MEMEMAVDDDPAVKDLEIKMAELDDVMKGLAGASIFMVPERLRELNRDAYTPRLLSIGPLHCRDPHLQTPEIQNIKLSYLNSLLARLSISGGQRQEKSREVFRECLREMANSTEEAKKYYADTEMAKYLSKEMLVIDGCFILEFLYKCETAAGENEQQHNADRPKPDKKKQLDDPLLGSAGMLITVQHDLLLLENQLPFLVLEKLFRLTVGKIPNHPPSLSIRKFVVEHFKKVINFQIDRADGEMNCHHILHLLHKYYSPGLHNQQEEEEEYKQLLLGQKKLGSASELDLLGAFFDSGNKANQFHIHFTEPPGTLESMFRGASFAIPRLNIFDTTELILRNLIALEQCCHGVEAYVTSYAFVMDSLINTDEDVRVLERAEVLGNYLGATREATDLFNNLCKQVVLQEIYFGKTYKKASEYGRQHGWARWRLPAIKTYIRRRYRDAPWTFIALVTGFMAFIISVVEFIRSVIRSTS